MPSNVVKIGPFSAIYIDDYAGTGILTKMTDIDTGPYVLVDEIPEQVEPVAGYNSVQAGLRKVSVTMAFYGESQILINLSRGLLVNEVSGYVGSPFNQYTLLLADADETATTSVLIPRCYTVKNMGINKEKTAPTKINYTFIATDRNRFVQIPIIGTSNSVPLMYMDTLDNIATALGGRSPV